MFDIKKMQEMQAKLQERLGSAQEELETKRVTGSAGGGALKVVCDGNQRVLSVDIQPGIVDLNDEDREMLQDLMTAAANQAIDSAKELSQKNLGDITGGMKIPGLNL